MHTLNSFSAMFKKATTLVTSGLLSYNGVLEKWSTLRREESAPKTAFFFFFVFWRRPILVNEAKKDISDRVASPESKFFLFGVDPY